VRRLTGFLLTLPLTCALGACATGGAVPRPFPGSSVPTATQPPPAVAEGTPPAIASEAASATPDATAELVATALNFRGVPYRNGGTDPTGFDCSGFVQYVFARFGTGLPRETKDQFHAGIEVDLANIQPGDLVFFQTVARGASHVGLAIGDDAFVHAPSSRGVVRVERFTSTYWSKRLLGVRRIALARGTSQGVSPASATSSQE